MNLFDTHNHFDFTEFDNKQIELAQQAYQANIKQMLMAGYCAQYFDRLVVLANTLNTNINTPKTHLAFGLHPAHVFEHQTNDIIKLEQYIAHKDCIALGEIGIDTYHQELRTDNSIRLQSDLFIMQLELAKQYNLPVILHVRKSHGLCIKLLKQAKFQLGGIAHSFSGGIQEARALVKLGFKIGITGQVCNQNAKKLHSVVQQIGTDNLVIETDCPDMLPSSLYNNHHKTINEPKNLLYVLDGLVGVLSHTDSIHKEQLAEKLWCNSCTALHLKN